MALIWDGNLMGLVDKRKGECSRKEVMGGTLIIWDLKCKNRNRVNVNQIF